MMAQKAKDKYGTTAAAQLPAELRLNSPHHHHHHQRNNHELDCSICTLSSNTKVALLCGHVMCDQCAIRSIETHEKCPFCQRPAQTQDIRRIY